MKKISLFGLLFIATLLAGCSLPIMDESPDETNEKNMELCFDKDGMLLSHPSTVESYDVQLKQNMKNPETFSLESITHDRIQMDTTKVNISFTAENSS